MSSSVKEPDDSFKSGFVSLIGRPNVGKSSLLNQLVGNKVAIISDKPQTTRNAIRGILSLPNAQVVFIDTPGFHKPRNLLGEHLNQTVVRTLREVDAVVLVLDASQDFGKGDEFVAERVSQAQAPVICVVNKADLVTPDRLLRLIDRAGALGNWVDVLTTSAKRGTGLDYLVRGLLELIHEGPMYYPEGSVTDQPEKIVVAEIIREKVLELTRQEVPHSVAVLVDDIDPREDSDLIDIAAKVYLERDSQKAIVIGRGGKMLKEIGSRAREEIEALLGSRVFLDLRVSVEPRWQRDERLLTRFGY